MGSRPLPGRRRVAAVAIAAVVAVIAAAAVVDLRTLRPEAFYAARGDFAGARVIERRDTETSLVRHLVLTNRQGTDPAEAYFRRPRELAPDYRVIVTYAGARTGETILSLIPERPDVVLLAVQYPYRKPTTFLGKVRWAKDVREAGYRTVAGGMLGVSYLLDEERLAADRIAVVGTSLGSIFAVLHGALDERVPRVLAIHGGGNFPVLLRSFADEWWKVPLSTLFSRVLVYSFDPVHWVDRIAPRELVVIAARHDERFPLASSSVLFERAREPKRWIWTESNHVRSGNDALVEVLVDEIDRLVGSAPPAPSREPS